MSYMITVSTPVMPNHWSLL